MMFHLDSTDQVVQRLYLHTTEWFAKKGITKFITDREV